MDFFEENPDLKRNCITPNLVTIFFYLNVFIDPFFGDVSPQMTTTTFMKAIPKLGCSRTMVIIFLINFFVVKLK
jgi:hypothetical protein